MEKQEAYMNPAPIRKSNLNEVYYSNTASSLSKRPLSEIYSAQSKLYILGNNSCKFFFLNFFG